MPLTKDSILKSVDLVTEKVNVPEWGDDVHIKSMTASERSAYEDVVFDTEGETTRVRDGINIWSELLVRTICDESGKRIFADADATKLAEKSAPVLIRLYRIAKRINAIGAEEEETKKSPAAPTGDSSLISV